MKKGIISKLKRLIPHQNIAFSWCACGTWKHAVHSSAIKKCKKSLVTE